MTEDNEGERDLHLRVSVGEITIEVNGPVDEAETWFESLQEDYLRDLDTAIPAANGGVATETNENTPPSTSSSSQAISGKSRSLTEYYKMADNPTKQESALITGWYLEYQEGQNDFTKGEIKQYAKDAKISLGANVSRDLRKQVKAGNIEKVAERDGNDTYHITLSGEDYVQEELLDIA